MLRDARGTEMAERKQLLERERTSISALLSPMPATYSVLIPQSDKQYLVFEMPLLAFTRTRSERRKLISSRLRRSVSERSRTTTRRHTWSLLTKRRILALPIFSNKPIPSCLPLQVKDYQLKGLQWLVQDNPDYLCDLLLD
jgi:CBS-domain-containing membrane protein